MHMYEYNESSTRYSKTQWRTNMWSILDLIIFFLIYLRRSSPALSRKKSGELNIKLEDTVDNRMLALVIYTASAFNINTTGRTTITTYN
jgi:hypothetical protein